ncbi:MAG TPA: hypothetical protein VFQ95_07000 [Rhodanobacteraceae bacterium]|nr:hypothetical protein [Rhodanobacteraceae bacterium]
MRRVFFAAAVMLLLGVGGAVAAAPPASTSRASAPATKPTSADRKRMAAIEQYRHDLVNVIALRADRTYLLGAAFLARAFKDPTPGLDFASLTERVAAASDAQAVDHWARLGACTDAECPDAKSLAWLEVHAGDNAAVWLMALDFAKDEAARRKALHEAAVAKVYDDYYGQVLAAVATATLALPPLPATLAGARHAQPNSADGVRMLVALTAMQPYPAPGFGPVDRLCNRRAAAGVKADCLKLAHTLQWGSSPLARAMGLRIQGELDPPAAATAHTATANLKWQVAQYSTWLQHALAQPGPATAWLARARGGGTELSLMLATLRAANVPIDAPARAGQHPATD